MFSLDSDYFVEEIKIPNSRIWSFGIQFDYVHTNFNRKKFVIILSILWKKSISSISSQNFNTYIFFIFSTLCRKYWFLLLKKKSPRMYLPPKEILMYFLSKLIDFQRCQKTSLFRKFQMPAGYHFCNENYCNRIRSAKV